MLDSIQADPNIIFAPFMMVSLGVLAIFWFAMLGGSLKFSVGLCSDESPSYLRCVLTAIFMIGINALVFVSVHSLLGRQPWYVVSLYQLFLQSVLVVLLLRIQPISACIASIAHGFFAGIGTFVLGLAFLFSMIPVMKGMKEREGNFLGRETVSTPHNNPMVTPVSNKSGAHSNPFVES